MNISVTFSSEDEFTQFIDSAKRLTQLINAAKEANIISALPENSIAEEVKTEADPTKKMPGNEMKKEPAHSEDMRVEARKVLAQLNKKTGKNIARDLIKEFGVSQLTEVRPEDLPALLDKAKEALNAK